MSVVSIAIVVANEQVNDWHRRGVTIADACLSLGRRPVDRWDHVIAIVAAEYVKALRITEARQYQTRGRVA